MTIAERIREKIAQALEPLDLDLVDDSHQHIGHAGHDPRGESHFSLTIVSERFEGMSRVDRQRKVYAVLAEELSDRVHALALRTLTPAEAAALAKKNPR